MRRDSESDGKTASQMVYTEGRCLCTLSVRVGMDNGWVEPLYPSSRVWMPEGGGAVPLESGIDTREGEVGEKSVCA